MRPPRRIPWFGVALACVTVAFEALTHFDHSLFPELQRHLALNWESLTHFEFYRIVVSPFIQTSPGFSPTILSLTSVVVPVYELREGTRRAIALFFMGDWLSTLPVLFALQAAGWLGNATAGRLAGLPDSGSSCGGFACLAAFCCSLPFRWRVTGLAALVGFSVVRLASWHRMFDFQHALATLVGIAAWHWLERRRERRRPATTLVPVANSVG